MTIRFAEFDMRRTPEAAAHNDAIFAAGPVLGIEVTDAALAERCSLGNIDPQHGLHIRRPNPAEKMGSQYVAEARDRGWLAPRPGETAIEFVGRGIGVPCLAHDAEAGMTIATIRPDLDSIGAMAVISLLVRADAEEDRTGCGPATPGGTEWTAGVINGRLLSVADADRFSPGGEWQPAPLPTREQPWGDERGSVDSRRSLAAINKAVQDRDVPLAQRVEWMAQWLLTGEEPEGLCPGCHSPIRFAPGPARDLRCLTCGVPSSTYRTRVEADRLALVESMSQPDAVQVACGRCGDIGNYGDPITIETSRSTMCMTCGGGATPIAVVQVEHMGATGIGYCLSPIVVARRPSTGKVTIAWWRPGVVLHDALLAALNAEEAEAGGVPKWGGGATIVGSPQAEGTRLELGRICHLVARHRLAHAA